MTDPFLGGVAPPGPAVVRADSTTAVPLGDAAFVAAPADVAVGYLLGS